MKRLLSIDGGGIRGLIPAMALEKLERDTGKPTREIFDFIGGTSTGALLCSAIACGVPASKMAEVYRTRTQEIFSGNWNVFNRARQLVHGYLYEIEPMQKVVEEVLGGPGYSLINEQPIDVLITAVEVKTKHSWFFVRDKPENARTTGGYRLIDAALASSCAPTYFPPMVIQGIGELVDGGVGVTGNPSYQLCVEAFEYSSGYIPSETILVSLGTGRASQMPGLGSGLLGALNWTIAALLDAPEQQQGELVKRHYAPQMAGYHRFDVSMSEMIEMDDLGALPKLEEYGRKMADSIDWDRILYKEGGDHRGNGA